MTDGTTLGAHLLADRYQIGELLGRGGMAEVHAGFDSRLGRQVAVKLLRPALATDPAFRTRFRQEAQAAARMSHPTIVRVYDAGEQTVPDPSGTGELQLPFIVMERVEGTLLKELLSRGPVEPNEAVRIAQGILTALEYSHRAGVVHRDIKPGNVMITSNGQVKVMDFGIARAISDSSASIAQTSAILGTAQYFSPEQARGEAVDARTDLYSTGVVLYELLTGRPPFQAEGAVAVAYQHVSEAPVPPSTLNPAVSPALSAVVLRALAKDRFERYQSASDFSADLDVAVAGKVPDAIPRGDDFGAALFGVNPNSTAASEATLRRLAEGTDDRAPRTQTRPPVAWIWGSIALLAIVVGAALYWVFTLATPQLSGAGTAVDVPDVVGENFEAVQQSILDAGLRINDVERVDESAPAGTILETIPEAGVRVSPDYEITVIISAGPPKVTLPGLTYKSEDEAIETIQELGLDYGSTRSTYSPNVPKGVVIGIELPGGGELITGNLELSPDNDADPDVNLVISNGLVKIPDVEGEAVTSARDALNKLQLTIKLEADTGCSGNDVISQSLKGDQKQKSTITIRYCAG